MLHNFLCQFFFCYLSKELSFFYCIKTTIPGILSIFPVKRYHLLILLTCHINFEPPYLASEGQVEGFVADPYYWCLCPASEVATL